jgi:hypothetical protein
MGFVARGAFGASAAGGAETALFATGAASLPTGAMAVGAGGIDEGGVCEAASATEFCALAAEATPQAIRVIAQAARVLVSEQVIRGLWLG